MRSFEPNVLPNFTENIVFQISEATSLFTFPALQCLFALGSLKCTCRWLFEGDTH